MFYSWVSLFTNLVPLYTHEYKQATENCQGALIKHMGKPLMD